MTMPAIDLPQIESSHGHITVMLSEVVAALRPIEGGLFVDVTAGAGGHSEALLEAIPGSRVFSLDRDIGAVETTKRRLSRFGARAQVFHRSFGGLSEFLKDVGIASVDGVVADLGLSSVQLDDAERGMSFRFDGPLDMRMDQTRGETARDLVARLSQDDLADVIYQFGEERRSRRVARCIKQALTLGELETTADLRRAVVKAVGPRRVGGIDPATRTFQALRIAVNRELGELEDLLRALPEVVHPGGRVALISFHSLEDRLVKYALKEASLWRRLHNKPLQASSEEQEQNPRSRSAKLRTAERQLAYLDDELDREPL